MRQIKYRVSKGQETIGYETINDGQWFASDAGVNWANGSYAGPTLKRWQYTGLKDKLGNEIYEGDIVEVDTSHDDEGLYPTPFKDEVRFADGAFYPVCELPTDKGVVVIGNIHENPELLR